MATIQNGTYSVSIEQEWIDVTSPYPTPNERWTFTDSNGHDHRYDHGYPTLTHVVDASHWCYGNEGIAPHDPHEAVDESHYECATCGEVVEPKMDPGYTPKRTPGIRRTTLNAYRSDGSEVVVVLLPDEVDVLRGNPDPPVVSAMVDAMPFDRFTSVTHRGYA